MEKLGFHKRNRTTLKEKLRNDVIMTMTKLGKWKEDLLEEIPTYWDNYNNCVIFNSKFFVDSCWIEAGSQLWECISIVFSGKSVALQGKIQNNDFRSPSATLVYGESPWIKFVDNGINYTWNVEFTMFCTGNVSERHRIAKFNCRGKVVVDMFAGIGYFTLPYLVYAKAKKVISCEWNSVSVQALQMNLLKNKVAENCVIFEGDVRIKCPRGVADHVNMGLIPSCEQYWSTAAEILNPSGGMLHVHGNVSSFSKVKNLDVQCKMCLNLIKTLPISLSDLAKDKHYCDFLVRMLDKTVTVEKLNNDGCVKWKKMEWFLWGLHVSHSFSELLHNVTETKWTVTPTFLHRIKTYAPHIDHLVLDISCQNE